MRAWLLGLALSLGSAAWGAGAPTGLLWHNGFWINAKQGRSVHVSPLDGCAPIQILPGGEMDVAVWPDGQQFVVTRPNIYQHITDFVVMTRGGAAVYQGRLSGYVRDVVPSPADRRFAKITQGDSPRSAFEELVIDFATLQPRRRIATDEQFAWLPDGRFMLIHMRTGSMRVGSLDGARETVVGQLTLPPDRVVGEFAVSPTGREFIMGMRRRNSVPAEADLWIGSIDGSRFEQFTDLKALGGAVWSPDGRFIAYTADTGHACSTRGYCNGSCDQYFAPASLRKVRGLDGVAGSEAFHVRNLRGQQEKLGCHVLAWTP